jgi:hypothetical protein
VSQLPATNAAQDYQIRRRVPASKARTPSMISGAMGLISPQKDDREKMWESNAHNA